LDLHHCHRRLERLCCHQLHVPTPNRCENFGWGCKDVNVWVRKHFRI
jgi:hypothetical protein